MPKLIRITTVPIALKYLLAGQMRMMKENGFDVIMISADGPERKEIMQRENCCHIVVPMTRRITPFTDLQCLWKLIRIFKKEKPDIVHTHTPKAGLLGMMAAKITRVPVRIHTVAGLRFFTATRFTKWLLVKMEKWTYRSATNIWPNSFSLMKFLQENNMAPVEKLDIIGSGSSNGIDLNRFSTEALQTGLLGQAMQQMKYDPSLTYLLCIGRIVKDKGVEELLRVFQHLYYGNQSLRLVLLGSFEEELDPVSIQSRQILKEHPGIIHINWSDSVEYFIHLSSLLVHPSHREGFPNVLLQAGAMKCPVVCSRIGGNVDIIDDRQTGLIFDLKNENDLESTLNFALQNTDLLKQYADNLRKKIEERFNQKFVQEILKKKYLELLNEN